MYRVRWPWASRSISRTRCPISASAAPRLTAVVVLPTPPFCIATAIVRAKSAPSLTEPGPFDPTGRSSRARHLELPAPVIIDIVIVLVVVVALITGFQRGVIQPLMAEIFFFGTLLAVFRFHDQYTTEMQKLLHLTPVLSVFLALIIAVVLGAIGGAIGGMFHRMEAIRGVDGLLGVFVHGAVTVVVIYLAVSALVTLDNAFQPTLKSANLTLTQVNQLENQILSNPITAALVSKSDLAALKAAAAKNNAAHLDSVGGIHQLQQIYTDFLQPQLHGSRIVPFILGFGKHLPFIGRVGPEDLKPVPTPSPVTCPSPSVKATASPKPTTSPKTTPTPVRCPTPSPTK